MRLYRFVNDEVGWDMGDRIIKCLNLEELNLEYDFNGLLIW